jgi:hypothetical protein
MVHDAEEAAAAQVNASAGVGASFGAASPSEARAALALGNGERLCPRASGELKVTAVAVQAATVARTTDAAAYYLPVAASEADMAREVPTDKELETASRVGSHGVASAIAPGFTLPPTLPASAGTSASAATLATDRGAPRSAAYEFWRVAAAAGATRVVEGNRALAAVAREAFGDDETQRTRT